MRPAVVIGAASAIAFCIGAALGGGSTALVMPEPTPKIITTTKIVEIPQPEPTPLVVTREVEVAIAVTPQSCLDALEAGDTMISAFGDFLDAMINEQWKKADRATTASGDAMADWYSASEACRDEGAGS